MDNPYDADYFLRGKESGKSLYTDYRWLPDLTIPMAKVIVDHLKVITGELVLDFGCARGYVVKALRILGHDAYGVDVSDWAIENCEPSIRAYVSIVQPNGTNKYHHIIAKDVLEHIDRGDLERTIQNLFVKTRRSLFAVVPLSENLSGPYVVPEYEQDITHKIRKPLHWWHAMFRKLAPEGQGWTVSSCYRIVGIKDNYYTQYPYGNGFITAVRDYKLAATDK